MARRSISAKQRAWLASQLESWRSDGIISDDQSSRVLDLYETPTELAERGRSTLLLVLMGLAALLIGAAVLLLIGYNWQAMPATVKLLIIFTILLATYAGAFHLRYVRQLGFLSEIVFFLGCLFFGAAIFLIAQIFNLSGHYPDTFWWWALGVFPFAICTESILLHMLLVALLAIWSGTEVFGFSEMDIWFWGRWGDLPNGAYSLLLFVIPGFVWAYRRSSQFGVALYVHLLAWWTILQPFAWRLNELGLIFIGAVGGLMLLVAGSHPRGNRLAVPYFKLGTLLIGGALIVLSIKGTNNEIFARESLRPVDANDWRLGPFLGRAGSWALLAATAILAVGVLYLASKFGPDDSSRTLPAHERMLRTARRQWMPVAMTSLMLFLFVWWCINGGPLIPTILGNIAMIVLGFWLIGEGLHDDAGRTFAMGVGYLLVWIVMRYIDTFGENVGMLGTAGIFFVCGFALLGAARFWRHRKELQHV